MESTPPDTEKTGEMNGSGVSLTRRRLLLRTAQGAVALSGANVLAACGGGTSAGTTTGAAGSSPRRGGTLNVGVLTAGAAETLNPALLGAIPDIIRGNQLYDSLFAFSPKISEKRPALAVSAEPDATAKVWTFKLRDGVTWHDGKSFSADDVVYTIKGWASPKNFANGQVGGLIDFKGVRKRDRLTVEVPLLSSVAQFPSILTAFNCLIVQNGATDFSKPVGTGPFKFVSFTPGQQSVFAANRNYWEHPKPYVDSVVVNSSFSEEAALENALLSGRINVFPFLPPLFAKQQGSTKQVKVLQAPSAGGYDFEMAVDLPPFNDVRVRQAMRLIADRPALIQDALAGFGVVGNDIMGEGSQYFDASLTRHQDVAQAKSLLKAAGKENLTFTLATSPVQGGFVQAATIFAQQAAAAGVKVNVQQIPSANYYNPATGYLRRPIQANNFFPYSSLTAAYRAFLNGKEAIYNGTHQGYNDPAWTKLLGEAIATTNETRAQELWNEVQSMQFSSGGLLLYATADNLDAVAANVHGILGTPAGNLNNYRLLDGWIA